MCKLRVMWVVSVCMKSLVPVRGGNLQSPRYMRTSWYVYMCEGGHP
jgi:hypothetical protein